MRVLAIADLHGDRGIYEWLVRIANAMEPDAVVLAGDLLGWPEGFSTVEEAQRSDAEDVLSILESIQVPVLYVMGNDDMVELESKKALIRTLHRQRIEMNGFNVVGYQYSLPFMGGVFEKPEADIETDLAELSPLVDERTLLVTHTPVFGILDIGIMGVHAGSESLLRLIELRQPVAHVHGHIHSCFGASGRHYNVAAAGNRRAILLDLENRNHEVVMETVIE